MIERRDPPLGEEAAFERILAQCFEDMHAGRRFDLEARCAGDAELRSRVERALAQQRAFAEFFAAENARAPGAVGHLAVDTVIDDFRIVRFLGAGGMGEVYEAVQLSLGRCVALKVLSGTLRLDSSSRLRFQREASITAALNHPHIVSVYATGRAGDVDWLAMRLVAGQRLDGCRGLEPRRAARYAAQIATALQAAHDVGVVHRDVKPANVMIEGDEALLLDFGLARIESAATMTQADAAPGTLPYMAPERLGKERAAHDPRIDVYGLGATLYEVLSGRPPFPSDPPAAAIQRILHFDPPPLPRSVDRDLAVIVMRAMDKVPARRFASAAQLATDLLRYLHDEPIASRPSGVTRRMAKFVRRRPVASTAILLGSLSSLIVALLVWRHAHDLRVDFDRQASLLRDEVLACRYDRATDVLRAMHGLHPGDPRLVDFEGEIAERRALDTAILDVPRRRSELAEARERLAGLVRIPRDDPRVVFMHIASALQNGDHDLVRAELITLNAIGRYPRTCAAIAAVLDGEKLDVGSLEVRPGGDRGDAVDDHLLTAKIGQIVSAPLRFWEAEVYAAEDLEPANLRTRMQLADVLRERQDLRALYEVLRGVGAVESLHAVVPAKLAATAAVLAHRERRLATFGIAHDETSARWIERSRRHLADAERLIPEGAPLRKVLDPVRWSLAIAEGKLEEFWQSWRARSDMADSEEYWVYAHQAIALGSTDASQLDWLRRVETSIAEVERRLPFTQARLAVEARAICDGGDGQLPVQDPDRAARLRSVLAQANDAAEAAAQVGRLDLQGRLLRTVAGVHEVLDERELALKAAWESCSRHFDPLMVSMLASPLCEEIASRTESAPAEPPITDPEQLRLLELIWDWIRRAQLAPEVHPECRALLHVQCFWLAYERGDAAAMLQSAPHVLAAPPRTYVPPDFIGRTLASGLPPLEAVLAAGPRAAVSRARLQRLMGSALGHLARLAEADARRIAQGWLDAPELAPFRDELAADDPLHAIWQRVRALAGR